MDILVMALVMPSLFYVLAAVLPAAILLVYVYRQDRVEREPAGLLRSLLWQGVKAALLAIVLETLMQVLLGIFLPSGTFLHTVLTAFLVVAAVE